MGKYSDMAQRLLDAYAESQNYLGVGADPSQTVGAASAYTKEFVSNAPGTGVGYAAGYTPEFGDNYAMPTGFTKGASLKDNINQGNFGQAGLQVLSAAGDLIPFGGIVSKFGKLLGASGTAASQIGKVNLGPAAKGAAKANEPTPPLAWAAERYPELDQYDLKSKATGKAIPGFENVASLGKGKVAKAEAMIASKKAFYGKGMKSDESMAVALRRNAAQQEINTGSPNYKPYFDVSKRENVDPSGYPIGEKTIDVARPAKASTAKKYEDIANDPAAEKRLMGAYERGKKLGGADKWYYMKQLEDEFVKEHGKVDGRKMFTERFTKPMAATTGGMPPQTNLLLAHWAGFEKQAGRVPGQLGYEMPYPIAGGKYGAKDNINTFNKLDGPEAYSPKENPKRTNFQRDFEGHGDAPTLDEQMMGAWIDEGGVPYSVPPPNSYGIFEEAITKMAKKAGVDPREFQEVAWAGLKHEKDPSYVPHSMIETVNEAIHRTAKVTGKSQAEIVRKALVRKEMPLYSAVPLGVLLGEKNDNGEQGLLGNDRYRPPGKYDDIAKQMFGQ